MRIALFMTLFLFSNKMLSAQQDDLTYLIAQIKSNYAGYHDKTTDIIFDRFIWETVQKNKQDTFRIMAEIIDFFHDRHLDLFKERDSLYSRDASSDLLTVKNYLNNSSHLKKYEGYWINERNRTVIALKKLSNKPSKYNAYIVECIDTNNISFPGNLVYEFESTKKKNDYFTKANGGKKGWTFYIHSKFRNDSVMTARPYNKWKRISHYISPMLPSLIPRSIDTAKGYWLDSNNYVITIPASYAFNADIVDSIIKSNPAITHRLQNLIVDVRGNTGGTVSAFSTLFPLLYTNPILKVNGYVYCSEEEIKFSEHAIADYVSKGNIDSFELKEAVSWVAQEKSRLGGFLALPQDTMRFDSTLSYPKRVAIIIDYGCQSATEMTILQAQQSKKVTLFGEHTMGAVDYFDYTPHPLPSKKFTLYIAATKRIIPKDGKKLDGIGIKPDVLIEDSVPDWIFFVKKYYEKHQ